MPFTRKNRSAAPRGGRGKGTGKSEAANSFSKGRAVASAADTGDGRRGTIQVLECRCVVVNYDDLVAVVSFLVSVVICTTRYR